jgi:hypothetical protein
MRCTIMRTPMSDRFTIALPSEASPVALDNFADLLLSWPDRRQARSCPVSLHPLWLAFENYPLENCSLPLFVAGRFHPRPRDANVTGLSGKKRSI